MLRIKAWYLFFKSPSVPKRSVCCIEWKKARRSQCWTVFGHFLYCFASVDSRDFKFSATSDRKGPRCVAEFCAMNCHLQRDIRKEYTNIPVYCIHATVPPLPYFILHFEKPLLSGQLAHSRGWPLNRGVAVLTFIFACSITFKRENINCTIVNIWIL